MIHLKEYSSFNEELKYPYNLIKKEQRDWINSCITYHWSVNVDDPKNPLIDVDGDFRCNGKQLEDLKGVKFGTINGHFNCSDNHLTSMKGMPRVVNGVFNCSNNRIRSLVGGPIEVLDYIADRNKLKDLKGCARIIKSDLTLYGNELESLEGCAESIGRNFNVNTNKLESLKGGPKYIGRDYNCQSNILINLDGAPSKIPGSFEANDNNLTSLTGSPNIVLGSFIVYKNNLNSLKGGPEHVGENYHCSENSLKDLEGSPEKVKNFVATNNSLVTLNGGPRMVFGDFNVSNNELKNFKGAPFLVKNEIYFKGNQIDSLEGFPIIQSMEEDGNLKCHWITILEGGLKNNAHFIGNIDIDTFREIYKEMLKDDTTYGMALLKAKSKIAKLDWDQLDLTEYLKVRKTMRSGHNLLDRISEK